MAAFDFARFKSAVERADAKTLSGLYATDAEMTIVDKNNPPTQPMSVRGKAAISAFLDELCGRAMTHHVGREVVGADRAAFVEECAYPDGCRVMASMTLDLHEGLIARHLIVQAWNETAAPAT